MKAVLNTVYNAVNKEAIALAKEAILSSEAGSRGISTLNEKIDSVIDGASDPSKEDQIVHQMKTMIKNDALNAICGYTSDLDSTVKPIAEELTSALTDSFSTESSKILNIVESDNPGLDCKEKVKDALTSLVSEKIAGAIDGFSSDSIQYIRDNLYTMGGDFADAKKVAGDFVDNIFTGAVDAVKNALSSFIPDSMVIDGETVQKPDVLSILATNVESCIENTKNSASSGLSSIVTSGVDSIVSRLTENIQGVFCQENEVLQAVEQILPVGQMIQDAAGIAVDNFKGTINDALSGKRNPVNDSRAKTEAIKNEVKQTNKAKEQAAKSQEIGSNQQPSSPQPTQTKLSDKNTSSKKSTNVKDRKESGNNEKKEKKDPEEPELQNYDNSKPPAAQINNDPRRNTQELVLWQGNGGSYVLLRDKPGNYICFDEASNNVRLQNVCGSFIELRGNGDIIIQAAGNVLINSCAASYIKKN